MADDYDDFKNDPTYKKIRTGIIKSNARRVGWNYVAGLGVAGATLLTMVAVGLEVVTLGTATPIALGFLAAAAVIGYGAYKSWQAKKDAEMAVAEVTAARTGHYFEKTLEKQQEAAAEVAASTKFQDMLAAQNAARQSAGVGKS